MKSRTDQLQHIKENNIDVLVIGGGINGAVSAAVLSAAGIRTALVEARDFAGFTSQNSSNLIWGGIKYLESFEFGLVRKLCRGRNRLLKAYPTSIVETRFIAAVGTRATHSRLAIWAGAWVYWLLGGGFTAIPRLLSRSRCAKEEPVSAIPELLGGVEYSDGVLREGDARFVLGFIKRATRCGCAAVNYTSVTSMKERVGRGWEVVLRDEQSGDSLTITPKAVINAAGPFVDRLNHQSGVETTHHHRFSKGIHLIVDRLTPSRRVLSFFARDGRPFFVIPIGNRTCIGTTDTLSRSPEAVIAEEDRQFVLDHINTHLNLKRALTRTDIIAERCGVRPLAVAHQDQTETTPFLELSRRHTIETDPERQIISIFGGKLTDCLSVGDEILREAAKLGFKGHPGDWFGEPPLASRESFCDQGEELLQDSEADIDLQRLWRAYGEGAIEILGRFARDRHQMELLLPGSDLTRGELEWVRENEMVVTLDDFLRRRSLLAMTFRAAELASMPGLKVVSRILFGASGDTCYNRWCEGAGLTPRQVEADDSGDRQQQKESQCKPIAHSSQGSPGG